MKQIKTIAVALTLLVAPAMSFAQSDETLAQGDSDITQGIVVEGDSLPIGISLGQSFVEIEGVFGGIPEFDLAERTCERVTCTYIGRDVAGEELGRIEVSFRFNRNTSQFIAQVMSFDFEDWTTTAGLSLAILRDDVATEEELQDFYPAGLTSFGTTRRGAIIRAIQSRADGINMTSVVNGRTGDSAVGRIF